MSVSPIVPIEAQPVIERSRLGQDFPSTLKCWLREPLLHFLVLGLVVFAVYGYMHRGRGGVESSRQIALTLDDLRTMESYFESQWHRPPTPEEFNAMVEDKVREEVLYREAPHGAENAVSRRGRRCCARAFHRGTESLVRQEQQQVCPTQPLQLPASLFLTRQAW